MRWEPGTFGQTLRLKLDFWSRRVTHVPACNLTWKLYEAS